MMVVGLLIHADNYTNDNLIGFIKSHYHLNLQIAF